MLVINCLRYFITYRLRHPNVTELVGYCSEHEQHLLVYELHQNGTLHEFLHLLDDQSKALTWNNRVKIALGAARAIELFSAGICMKFVHHQLSKNFKSANILVDMEFNAHLSDCGFARLIHESSDEASGYNAPEVSMSECHDLSLTEFIDVHFCTAQGQERSNLLVRWATPQLHDIDALAKMVDPALDGLYPVKSLSRFADVIALCVQPEPEFRPPMSEVVESLVRVVEQVS
ncbi:UNVERIFIED_CONTAM: protein STRUBBELIG-RECEPTOR FAMILY 6 [Sesamum latifolium]|uniref:Protein STRUBBELIG-RECEPTOR FAMILY 6 n=1 Tax=Sesamum latifolium TaxID=2727402 RepID=A0AAW2S2M8_9LAMI